MNRDRLLTVLKLLALLLIAAVTAVGVRPSSAGSGYWRTSGSQILDSNNDPVRISGVNWYGFETTDFIAHGLWAQSYQAILNTIKSLGYNVIRIPFSNEMVESNPVPTNYNAALNPDLNGLTSLEILDKIVAYAGSIGLRVILDDHRSEAGNSAEDNGLWYTSAYPQSAWIDDWVAMVTRYNANPTVVGVICATSRTTAQAGAMGTRRPTGGSRRKLPATRCSPSIPTCSSASKASRPGTATRIGGAATLKARVHFRWC